MANLDAYLDDVAAKSTMDAHVANTSNPHGVTKAQVGLGNVDNTSDANKPISTATQTALDGKVDENVAITGATKTKITYDAKGLVTAGADATTADIADSSNKRYVTDAQLVVIGNTSGTNTGDETAQRIGDLINGATEKTTPVDADMVGLMDSAASNILKKLSWANLKATLKTYFDTLYARSATTIPTRYSLISQGVTMTSQPNSTQLMTVALPGLVRTRLDLTNATHIRIGGVVLTSSGSGNSPRIILSYYTAASVTVGDYVNIGTSEVSYSLSAVGVPMSSWIPIAAGAKTDVYVAAISAGGNGSASPVTANIFFDVY